ncbi:hypothetical protein MMC07_005822 [Pseudocyphellaria aurata]|nr:hypothetical protein [Pseudocyphellaria aurata]
MCDPLVNDINELAKNVLYNWARTDPCDLVASGAFWRFWVHRWQRRVHQEHHQQEQTDCRVQEAKKLRLLVEEVEGASRAPQVTAACPSAGAIPRDVTYRNRIYKTTSSTQPSKILVISTTQCHHFFIDFLKNSSPKLAEMGTPLPAPSDFQRVFNEATVSATDLVSSVNHHPDFWLKNLKILQQSCLDLTKRNATLIERIRALEDADKQVMSARDAVTTGRDELNQALGAETMYKERIAELTERVAELTEQLRLSQMNRVVATSKLSPKLPDPEKFTGDRTKLAAWIFQIRIKMTRNSDHFVFPGQDTLQNEMFYVISRLEGDAVDHKFETFWADFRRLSGMNSATTLEYLKDRLSNEIEECLVNVDDASMDLVTFVKTAGNFRSQQAFLSAEWLRSDSTTVMEDSSSIDQLVSMKIIPYQLSLQRKKPSF